MRVEQKLKQDILLRRATIDVTTRNGMVTLSGRAPSYLLRSLAEQRTAQVDGVRRITNQIKVQGSPTDREIASLIKRDWKNDPLLRFQNLNVDVQNRAATIRGRVDSQIRFRHAENVARRVEGVDRVHNTLRISTLTPRSSSGSSFVASSASSSGLLPSDETIKTEIVQRIRTDARLSGSPVFVMVKDGVASLEGVVDNEAQKTHTTVLALSVTGIRRVHNQVVVSPIDAKNKDAEKHPLGTKDDAEISQIVNVKLHEDLRLDADNISVSAQMGFVVLRGTVRSEFQSELAERTARSVKGVKWVVNQLIVKAR